MADPLEWREVDEDALVHLADRISAVLVPLDVVVLRVEVVYCKVIYAWYADR